MALNIRHLLLLCSLLLAACQNNPVNNQAEQKQPFAVVLGTIQDGGSPHTGCQKDCCKHLWGRPFNDRLRTCLGLVDPVAGKTFLIEATPDMPAQLQALAGIAGTPAKPLPDGILLTHAHIGHYSGLMYLGREAANSHHMPVYTLPCMKQFLETNGPWQQLVNLGNIQLMRLQADTTLWLTPRLSVTPIIVPHRDEYSETVGFVVKGPGQRLLFIPDIDKWQKWNRSLSTELKKVDIAFLDATFYTPAEIPGRNMSEIPHPCVVETMKLLDSLPASERSKVHFIHFNHTNPLLNPAGNAVKDLEMRGYHIAAYMQRQGL